jgi:1-acyl-sn-glycerol-3-phosphate acyltransferase
VVANHVSFVDPFYLFIAYLPAFVAKKDVEVTNCQSLALSHG